MKIKKGNSALLMVSILSLSVSAVSKGSEWLILGGEVFKQRIERQVNRRTLPLARGDDRRASEYRIKR